MPNCSEAGCKVYVADEGMFCRLHQGAGQAYVKVTYMGDGMAQTGFGNFVKGTTANVPRSFADSLKSDKNWQVHG